MGNCCRSQSSTLVWAGDDWGSFSSKHRRTRKSRVSPAGVGVDTDLDDYYSTEKQTLLGEKKMTSSSPSASVVGGSSVREVKIKMTKKELEDLVGNLEMKGLSLQQLLSGVLNGEGEYEMEHQRSWRPTLQTIPEN